MTRWMAILLFISSVATAQESGKAGYTVTEERIGGAKGATEVNTVRFVVKDSAGIPVTTVEKKLPYDVPFPSVGVFGDGTLMMVHAFDGLIEFYRPGRGAATSIRPAKDTQPEHERVMRFVLHESTAVFLVSEPSRLNAWCFLIDGFGKILWEQEMPGSMAGELVISPDGGLIGASTYAWEGSRPVSETVFLSSSGNKIASTADGFKKGSFSSDGKRFVGFAADGCFVFDVGGKRVLWRDSARPGKIIIGAVITGDGISVLQANIPVLKDGSWLY
ncbi:MAG: hypothetical protein WBD36_13750, partial [Bacteroidota bacterium]